ncbi:hypothetical protein L0P88_18975 [Muricauda sp. SCSIO 64092]|uniref:hypothetical protein n=1 Tax=Allomuricauda sp. SCSIO 64092 TaxID=2908842 RepID=UPI001FF3396E|nr:hypothetical protein [Muricauda sp. SCSIO 64092]UOY06006.1 hypothetical protein L0P88_18975 [Muricauda sp. SCSIO 64092]
MKTTYRAVLPIGTLLLSFLANAQVAYNEFTKHTFTTNHGTIELGSFITSLGHIYTDRPNIPSAKELETNGIQLGEMDMKLLEKIEELMLYILSQEKKLLLKDGQIAALYNLVHHQEKRLKKLENLLKANEP